MQPSKAANLLIATLLCCITTRIRADEPAKPSAAWDAAFTRTEGWTGGDVAGTVDLGDGRVLWLFGDSWVGKIVDGGHGPGSQLVNNSIAIQTIQREAPHQPPTAAQLAFHWGASDAAGHPTAWIVSQSVGQKSDAKNEAANTVAKEANGWFWFNGGGTLVPGPDKQPRLLLFMFHIGKRQGETGVWAFQSLGSAAAIIDNYSDPVEQSRAQQVDIPHAISTAAAKQDTQLRETSWGVAAWCAPAAAVETATDDNNENFLYVYGVRNESPLNRQLLLARMPAAAFHEFDAWRFYAGNEKWSAKLADAVPVAEGLNNELSVELLSSSGPQRTFLMVYSEAVFGRRIFLRTASRPEGPWSERTAIYTVPDLDRNRSYFTYAAKGHLLLSRPGELLVTYLVNAHDFSAMVKDASIYRPRFVRVSLDAVKLP